MTTSPLPRREPAPWRVPAGLILLSLFPIVGGAMRLTELAGGAELTSQNERFFDSPVPVSIHIVSVTVYSLLGAFQFVPSLRGRSWHRVAGRVLVPAGLLAALSGLWMAVFYTLPGGDGAFLLIVRVIIGSAMVVSIALGVFSVSWRRDLVRHGAWMTRAYAIGAAAGTEALLIIGPELLSTPLNLEAQGVITGTACVINLALAEHVIRRRARVPSGTDERLRDTRAGVDTGQLAGRLSRRTAAPRGTPRR
ncbi:DUF2306 domain-containing protein [Georgenia sp. SYP-B2076]|uniref:DUF2306 domain-containing protein n=1 Tax=Georgenia sp. SYP-B2076 TaxID=2495881 RepID=UPI000F8CB746|nr:DUF2306 domain-containing protein [Georgenia sp. SYP-B2076]